MKCFNWFRVCVVGLAVTVPALVGCSDVDSTPAGSDQTVGEKVEEAGDKAGEAIDDAADAVTPDRDIVDINTPLGDVNVSEDRATGRKKVDVDTE